MTKIEAKPSTARVLPTFWGGTRATYKEEEEEDRTRSTVSLSTNTKSWLRTLVVLGDQSRSRTT
jgi:hypothetical protein